MALLDSEIRNAQDAAGEFFRSVNKQMFINQGVHVASADGKALAASMPGRMQDGREIDTDESKRETWITEVKGAMERGLKKFGAVKPRDETTGDALPSDAVGVDRHGDASLGCYTRTMHRGLNPDGFGPTTIDHATLTPDELRALGPPKAVVGAEWTLPEAVARKFNVVLSSSCNDSLPRPNEVSSVRFTGKVERVENGVAYLRYEGHIAGDHRSVHKYVWSSSAKTKAGVGAFDVKADGLLSITLVIAGERRNSKYSSPSDRPEKFGGVLEWRRGGDER